LYLKKEKKIFFFEKEKIEKNSKMREKRKKSFFPGEN